MSWIMACVFVVGLVLALQEGAWFPWMNLAGLGLSWVAFQGMGRLAPVKAGVRTKTL